MFRLSMILAGMIASLHCVAIAGAGVVFFSDRSQFESHLQSGFTVEDFESNSLTLQPFGSGPEPLNSSTSSVLWPTGISPGLTVANLGSSGIQVVNGGRPFQGAIIPSDAVGAAGVFNDTLLMFNPRVQAVGLDYFTVSPLLNNSSSIQMRVFAGPGALLGQQTVTIDRTPRFFGVISTGAPIDAVIVDDGTFRVGEMVDNVTFGNVVPEPSSLAICAIMGCCGLVRRRRG